MNRFPLTSIEGTARRARAAIPKNRDPASLKNARKAESAALVSSLLPVPWAEISNANTAVRRIGRRRKMSPQRAKLLGRGQGTCPHQLRSQMRLLRRRR